MILLLKIVYSLLIIIKIKKCEEHVTLESKKHPVIFTVEDDNFIGQATFTKGCMQATFTCTKEYKFFVFKTFFWDNSVNHKIDNVEKTRDLSLVEVNSKPAYGVNTAILKTPLYNSYILTDTFDVDSVKNEKDKKYIKDVMSIYEVSESNKLGGVIRDEFFNQQSIKIDDAVVDIDKPLIRIPEDHFMKHRWNKAEDYGLHDCVDKILNN